MRYEFLIYITLAFLLVYLYQADLLVVPQEVSLGVLALSVVLLFSGFLLNAVAWKQTLRQGGFLISPGEAISGIGLSIFGKYVPGKIWVVVGRAAYSSHIHGWPLGSLSMLSLYAQFVTLWVGLLLGVAGMFMVGGAGVWGWPVLSVFAVISVILFLPRVNQLWRNVMERLLKKKVTLPLLSFRQVVDLLPVYLVAWGSWVMAFSVFAAAFPGVDANLVTGLGFAMASVLGIITVFTPGGIGTREAVLVGFLVLAGLPVADATTISVASRLWFLGGEVFIFLFGWLLKVVSKKSKTT